MMTHNNSDWSPQQVATRLNDVIEKVQSDDHYQSIFTQLFTDNGQQIVEPETYPDHPLAGSLLSVKDLFDVTGYTTKAGTQYRSTLLPATKDATVVKRMRSAGAIAIGHTNMTELAYSGLGLNPHFGTPENALYPGCIPGGSTSGGALTVAHQFADIALGTDTGGSLRIPAAFNGIVGFKPTQRTVSLTGCVSLSSSLDSAGPMARDVGTCRLAYNAISYGSEEPSKAQNPKLIIPDNFGLSDLDSKVEEAFKQAVTTMEDANFAIEKSSVPVLDDYASIPVWHFSAVESRATHNKDYQEYGPLIDPRVYSRMARADEVDAISYRQTLDVRHKLIAEFNSTMQDTWLLMPTVPILPPRFDSLINDEDYYRMNLQVLRNPSIANVLDGCSISIPYRYQSDVIGIMLIAPACNDHRLLELAGELEHLLAEAS